ncbi:MAG: 2-amino-4-hydroxy-6-hydroxymethyldihydropteridine diphosphokinase, partial [Alicyclobacillus sp.]|nr:2-amino-4-hydroxy-6-hydroxymethyldihydropteridine diphosphokinase [Alicyclobacillus sp.]
LEQGRVRSVRYGPRTLDLDILLYNRVKMHTETLQIPHPRMWERAFVLIPLAQLVPGLPGPDGRTVRQWAETAEDREDVRYVGRFW